MSYVLALACGVSIVLFLGRPAYQRAAGAAEASHRWRVQHVHQNPKWDALLPMLTHKRSLWSGIIIGFLVGAWFGYWLG